MGAGAELGIYIKAKGIFGRLGSLDLTLNGKNVGGFEVFHWWATSFNPSVQGVNPDDLSARFTVNFKDKQMYNDFKKQWIKDARWHLMIPQILQY